MYSTGSPTAATQRHQRALLLDLSERKQRGISLSLDIDIDITTYITTFHLHMSCPVNFAPIHVSEQLPRSVLLLIRL